MDDLPLFIDITDFLHNNRTCLEDVITNNMPFVPKVCTLGCSEVKDLVFFYRVLRIPLEEVGLISNPIYKVLPKDLKKAFPEIDDHRARLMKYGEFVPKLPEPESVLPAPVMMLSFDYQSGINISWDNLLNIFDWSKIRAEHILIVISKMPNDLGIDEMNFVENRIKTNIRRDKIEIEHFRIKEGNKIGLWGRF